MIGRHKFTVRGKVTFPLDMLRYDCCYPATQEDVAKMAESLYTSDGCEIQLEAFRDKKWQPTKERWKSFLWEVIHHEVHS
jgi:DUF1680 family protein